MLDIYMKGMEQKPVTNTGQIKLLQAYKYLSHCLRCFTEREKVKC